MYTSYNFQKYTTLHHQGNEDPLCHFRFLLRLPQLDRNQQLDPFRAKPACQSERVVGTRFARVKAQKCREKVGEAGQRGEGRERQPLEWNKEGGRTRWCPPVFIARGLCLLGNRPSGLTSREKSVMGDVLREACTRLALLAGIDFGGTLSLFPVDDVSWDKIVSARSEIQARWIRSANHVQHNVHNTCSPLFTFVTMNFFFIFFSQQRRIIACKNFLRGYISIFESS